MTQSVMMSDLLGPDAVMAGVEAADKKSLLQTMARHAASTLALEEHQVTDILWEREKLGTTGVGHGIAIPHGRVPGLEKVHGFFVKLAAPIGFDAADNVPVDLVFLLLAPQDAGADHLHALACVSRTLRDPALCSDLRKAKDASALTKLLHKAPANEAP